MPGEWWGLVRKMHNVPVESRAALAETVIDVLDFIRSSRWDEGVPVLEFQLDCLGLPPDEFEKLYNSAPPTQEQSSGTE